MSIGISEVEEAEDLDRVERVLSLPLTHRQLQSITEADRTCQGFDLSGCVNGGDEPNDGEDICFACRLAEDTFYRKQREERDRRDAEASSSQYRYLRKGIA